MITLSIISVTVAILTLVYQLYIRKMEKVNRIWHKAGHDSLLSPKEYRFLSKKYRLRTSLRNVIMSHVSYSDEKFDASTYEVGSVMVQFYLDLMEAAVIPHELKILAKNLACFIKDTITYDYQLIIVPKNGNPLLGYAVSFLLRKRLLIVKNQATKQSYPFDGRYNEKERGVLIDDVSSDGMFLTRPIIFLRDKSIQVNDCIVLVHRKEGSARQRLEQVKVKLHALCEFSDQDLAELFGVDKV